MSSERFAEGAWVAVPLDEQSFAIGLIARRRRRAGPVAYAYFFARHYPDVPTAEDVLRLTPEDAILRARMETTALDEGRWVFIAHDPSWERSRWPMQQYVNAGAEPGTGWLITFSEDDPYTRASREQVLLDAALQMEPESIYPSRMIERLLARHILGRETDESSSSPDDPDVRFYVVLRDPETRSALHERLEAEFASHPLRSTVQDVEGECWLIIEAHRCEDPMSPTLNQVETRIKKLVLQVGGSLDGTERRVS